MAGHQHSLALSSFRRKLWPLSTSFLQLQSRWPPVCSVLWGTDKQTLTLGFCNYCNPQVFALLTPSYNRSPFSIACPGGLPSPPGCITFSCLVFKIIYHPITLFAYLLIYCLTSDRKFHKSIVYDWSARSVVSSQEAGVKRMNKLITISSASLVSSQLLLMMWWAHWSGTWILTPFANCVTLDMGDVLLNSSKSQIPHPKVVAIIIIILISWSCDD